jgi:uncharacterized protein (TIGR02118 family)
MYKVIGCWTPPAGEHAKRFEKVYGHHCEIACLLPSLRRYELTQFERRPGGSEPGSVPLYYRHAEMIFETREAAVTALTSAEAQRLYEDTRQLERWSGAVSAILGMGPMDVLLDVTDRGDDARDHE